MQFSLRELLFWITATGIGFAAFQWIASGLGILILLILWLFVLARLETFLPQPFVVLAAVLLLILGMACLYFTSFYHALS
jgi:hypothetical protein